MNMEKQPILRMITSACRHYDSYNDVSKENSYGIAREKFIMEDESFC